MHVKRVDIAKQVNVMLLFTILVCLVLIITFVIVEHARMYVVQPTKTVQIKD
jgi:hypothetical protein